MVLFSSVIIIWSVRSSQSNWFIDHQFCWFDPFLVSFRQSPPFCAVEGLDENRLHQRVHYIIVPFSALCLFLCLSRSVPDRAFSWPLPFVIWCHCQQLPSADFSEPTYVNGECTTTYLAHNTALMGSQSTPRSPLRSSLSAVATISKKPIGKLSQLPLTMASPLSPRHRGRHTNHSVT